MIYSIPAEFTIGRIEIGYINSQMSGIAKDSLANDTRNEAGDK